MTATYDSSYLAGAINGLGRDVLTTGCNSTATLLIDAKYNQPIQTESFTLDDVKIQDFKNSRF